MKGKICLITGANSGIGKAATMGLAKINRIFPELLYRAKSPSRKYWKCEDFNVSEKTK